MAEAGLVPGIDLISLGYRLEWMPDSAGDVELARKELGAIARSWRPDIIHCNQFCFGSLHTAAPRVVVAHSDLTGWITWHRKDGEYDEEELIKDPVVNAYREMVSRGLAAASSVVSPSRFMAQYVDEAYGCPSEVIYNGLWPDLYRPGPKTAVAVVAGRLWDEAKRAATAVEAADGLPVELRLIGATQGPSGERARLPQTANSTYTGPKRWKETREELASAQFCLATSSYEPFGLSMLEAAFCGCALIANDIPPFRELWKDSAAFYRRNDVGGLQAKLAELMKKPSEAERLGKAARSRATERYTAHRMTTQYHRLYRAI
jgi:glycosyltransferase involved in cell wall biosynthesis